MSWGRELLLRAFLSLLPWRPERAHLLFLFSLIDCRRKDLEKVPLSSEMNSIPGHLWVEGSTRSGHCFLAHSLYLPPVPSGARLYQTFTHLLLTLEVFRANKPFKKRETLPGSLGEYLSAKLSSLCWLVNSVDNFYS